MAYSLKFVLDTWMKQSTGQGSALPDDQRQFVDAGTVLPLAALGLVGNDHIKVTLGQDTRGNQIQFKGRNTWYVYRPTVQVLRDGQVVVLPDGGSAPPTTPTVQASTYTFKTLIDTWLKTSTAQGSTLPEDQKQFINGGTVLPIAAFAGAPDNHVQVTLGKDNQGNQLRFKGRNTWFVYQPAVQFFRNGQPIAAPAAASGATGAGGNTAGNGNGLSPSSYTLKIVLDTWLKTSTAQGSALSDDQKQFINAGTILPLAAFAAVEDNHLKVTFGQDAQGNPIQFKGRNTWFIYQPAAQVLRDGQPITPFPSSGQPSSGRTNAKGLRLIKAFEGLRLEAYQDAVGVWTIGYGTTSGVTPGMVITEAQAEALLQRDLRQFEAVVAENVAAPLNDDQFAALVSFTYNVGAGAFMNSTLLSLLNQKDYQGAAEQFLRWNRAGGQELAGLTRRRRAERALFLGEDFTVFL